MSELKNFREYLKLGEASEFLGVTGNTLRNWEKAGKIKVYRHPINNYRLYLREDMSHLLKSVPGRRITNDITL